MAEANQSGRVLEAPAWERPGDPLSRFVRTTVQILFHPVRSFTAPAPPGLIRPLIYALVVGVGAVWLQQIINRLTGGGPTGQMDPVSLMIVAPFALAAFLFCFSFFLSLAVRVITGRKGEFPAVFRVTCYAQAVSVVYLAPEYGVWVGLWWWLFIMVVAPASALGITRLKAGMSLAMGFVFCLAAGFVLSQLAMMFGLGPGPSAT